MRNYERQRLLDAQRAEDPTRTDEATDTKVVRLRPRRAPRPRPVKDGDGA